MINAILQCLFGDIIISINNNVSYLSLKDLIVDSVSKKKQQPLSVSDFVIDKCAWCKIVKKYINEHSLCTRT